MIPYSAGFRYLVNTGISKKGIELLIALLAVKTKLDLRSEDFRIWLINGFEY
jgi:hypothetical protein